MQVWLLMPLLQGIGERGTALEGSCNQTRRNGKIEKKEKLSKTLSIALLFSFLVASVSHFNLWIEVLVQMLG